MRFWAQLSPLDDFYRGLLNFSVRYFAMFLKLCNENLFFRKFLLFKTFQTRFLHQEISYKNLMITFKRFFLLWSHKSNHFFSWIFFCLSGSIEHLIMNSNPLPFRSGHPKTHLTHPKIIPTHMNNIKKVQIWIYSQTKARRFTQKAIFFLLISIFV